MSGNLQVRSADGTAIAFERFGDGPALIVVGGATCDRVKMRPVAEALGGELTAINYDRRGRGDSADTPPYAVEREVEDVAALIEAAGGTASLYGHSSGAGLVLHAAAAGLPVDCVVLHDPPYVPDEDQFTREARTYAADLDALLAAGRHGDAMAGFLTSAGMPADIVAGMRGEPSWSALERLAPTLAYDSAVMGDAAGGTVPTDLAARADQRALVLAGGANPPFMVAVAEQIARLLPHGELRVLEGEEHVVDPERLAPLVSAFVHS